MVFKNINAIFSLCFYFFDLFFEFLPDSVCIIKCYFGFSAFWIALNVLVQQVNVTELEVSIKIEPWQRSISHNWGSLTHCNPVLLFYAPWKHQKTLRCQKYLTTRLRIFVSGELDFRISFPVIFSKRNFFHWIWTYFKPIICRHFGD